MLGIPVLDHLIVGRSGYFSFRDAGSCNERLQESRHEAGNSVGERTTRPHESDSEEEGIGNALATAARAIHEAHIRERHRRMALDAGIAAGSVISVRPSWRAGRSRRCSNGHRVRMTSGEIELFFVRLLDSTDEVLAAAGRQMVKAFAAATSTGEGRPKVDPSAQR